MTKQEFMQLLEQQIRLLPLSERNRLINYYNEALEDRMEEGMSEEEAVASLDGLDALSLNLFDEIEDVTDKKSESVRSIPAPLKWFLLFITSPLWIMFPIVLTILLMVCGLLLIILLVLGVCFVIVSICGLFMLPKVFMRNIPSAIVLLGTILLSVGSAPWCWIGYKAWIGKYLQCVKAMPEWFKKQWQKVVAL